MKKQLFLIIIIVLLLSIGVAAQGGSYTVETGDTLADIAAWYGVTVEDLMTANGLTDADFIYVGQKLIVYPRGGGSGTSKKYASKSKLPVKRSKSKSLHTVRRGENLGLIAKKYKCTITDLKEWNNLKKSTIYPGQKLYVYKPESKSKNTVKEGKYIYHIVKKGDTLWDIAKEYDGVTVEQIKRLNHIRNSHRLKPGQKIKIAFLG
jgi:membrane-bound lytic murein transglycosylase D